MNSPQNRNNCYETPFWVKFFSVFFLIFLGIPIFILLSGSAHPIHGNGAGVNACGLHADSVGQPLLYYCLSTLLFWGGVTAVGLLAKWRWGLISGIGYSVTAIIFCIASFFVQPALIAQGVFSGFVDLFFLIPFLLWLCKTFIETCTNRILSSALHQPPNTSR